MKNIDSFLPTETSDSLWDKISDICPSKTVLRIYGGQGATIRFIGPFLSAGRKYIPESPAWSSFSSVELKKAIYDQNEEVMSEIKKRINSLTNTNTPSFTLPNQAYELPYPASKKSKKIINAFEKNIHKQNLDSLFGNKWSQVLFCNVLVKKYNAFSQEASSIKIFELSTAFLTVLSNFASIPISGVRAFDLDVSKTGEALTSKWTIKPSKTPSCLTKNEIESIMTNGLLDIKKILHEVSTESLNKKKGYLYRASENYRMPDEDIVHFSSQIKDAEEEIHIEAVEDAVDELPDDAFESKQDGFDAFSSIEIE